MADINFRAFSDELTKIAKEHRKDEKKVRGLKVTGAMAGALGLPVGDVLRHPSHLRTMSALIRTPGVGMNIARLAGKGAIGGTAIGAGMEYLHNRKNKK